MGKSKEDDDRARIWSGSELVDTGYREEEPATTDRTPWCRNRPVFGLGAWGGREGNVLHSRRVEDSFIKEDDLPGWRNLDKPK